MAFRGRNFVIFGAFKKKREAVSEERKHSGSFILPRTIKKKRRFVVLKEK